MKKYLDMVDAILIGDMNPAAKVTAIKNIVFDWKKLIDCRYAKVTIPDTFKHTSIFFGVSEEDVLSHTRKREIVAARMFAIYYLRENNYSLKSIGSYINRDHTSIMYSQQRIKDLFSVSPHEKINYKKFETFLEQYKTEPPIATPLQVAKKKVIIPFKILTPPPPPKAEYSNPQFT